ncbi:EamA family transporter [Spongiactinospora sp. 9N601]|uniref:DMT family transporter n=1 Tax=Spongiactinospora sp. 9N601 TaxID=3375149 RepID=UPI0037BB6E36
MAVVAPRPLLGASLLLFVSVAWGSAFPLMKDLIIRMPVTDLLTERYGLAALVLLAIRPRCLRGLPGAAWSRGVLLGVLFGVGQIAQAVALHSLPSSVSGFAVGCNVVMTPVLGLILLRMRVSRRVWVAVALSAAAMCVFTLLQGVEGQGVSVLALSGTLFAAALYAAHTLVLGQTSTDRPADSYAIAVIQLATIAVMTGVLSVPGGLTLPGSPADWAVLGHLAVVSCALGFLARTYGQAHVRAVPAAVLLSSQPLWVAVLAVLAYGEAVTLSVVMGGAMVAIAMLLVVVPGRGEDDEPEADAAESRVTLLRARRVASQRLRSLQSFQPHQDEDEDEDETAGENAGGQAGRPGPARGTSPVPGGPVWDGAGDIRGPRLPHPRGAPGPDLPRAPGGAGGAPSAPAGGDGPAPADGPVDQVVQHAIEVVRQRAARELIERYAPLVIVVDIPHLGDLETGAAALEPLQVLPDGDAPGRDRLDLDRLAPADPDAM